MIIFSFTLQGVIYLADLCQVHYSPGLFFLLERLLARVERRKLKMQKENLTRLLPLFENPKYMHAWVSWLDASLNPRCRVTQQYPYLYPSFFPPSNSVNLEPCSRSPREKGKPLVRELTGDHPAHSQPQACLKEPAVIKFQKLSQPVLGGAADKDKHM